MDKQFDITQLNMKQIENAKQMVRKRFPDLVNGYLRDADSYIANITDGLNSEDLEKVAKNAHALKSSSASLGVTGAYEVAKELEEFASEPEDRDCNALSHLADLLKQAMESATPKLRAFLEKPT